MDEDIRKQLKPGIRVKVVEQIPARDHVWTTEIRGTVLEYQQQQTGSWFAHSKGDKLWLDRLKLRKDDGEISVLNLDQFAVVQIEP
jgi:hypothetical protein